MGDKLGTVSETVRCGQALSGWGVSFAETMFRAFCNFFKKLHNVHLLCSSISNLAFFRSCKNGTLASLRMIQSSFLNGFDFSSSSRDVELNKHIQDVGKQRKHKPLKNGRSDAKF